MLSANTNIASLNAQTLQPGHPERQRRRQGRLDRGQILQQAGTAMLAQASSLPQSVLALLK